MQECVRPVLDLVRHSTAKRTRRAVPCKPDHAHVFDMPLACSALSPCCSSLLLYVHMYASQCLTTRPSLGGQEPKHGCQSLCCSVSLQFSQSSIVQYAVVFKSAKLMYCYSSECFHLILICTKSELGYYVSWLLHDKIWEVVRFLLFYFLFSMVIFTDMYLLFNIALKYKKLQCRMSERTAKI